MNAGGSTTQGGHREAFWTLVVGAPTALSVLRVWVEAGGELQTTLLLVSHVGPLNIGAALFATLTQLVTLVLIAIFATGGIMQAIAADAAPGSRWHRQPPMVARLAAAAPTPFVVAMFVLAAFTWKILFLPLLAPAAVAALQRPPWRLLGRPPRSVGYCMVALGGYGWLVAPAVVQAWRADEWPVAALLTLPPLVSLGIAGPLPVWFGRAFMVVAQPTIVALAGLVLWSGLQTPILPLVVTEVETGDETQLLRGHIISVDDVNLVLLLEEGGVRYLPVADVQSTVICRMPEDLPASTTRIHDFHVEDSVLRAVGRQVRPRAPVDPLCRIESPVVVVPQPEPGPTPSA